MRSLQDSADKHLDNKPIEEFKANEELEFGHNRRIGIAIQLVIR